MVFFNKNLMHVWSFNFPVFLILFEMALNIFGILVLKATRIIQVTSLDRFKFFFLGRRHFQATLLHFKYHIIVSIFYTLHSVTALKALNGLSVPMYIILKRCGPFINFLISLFMFKKKDNLVDKSFHKKINVSIFAMTGGVIIAGCGDLNFDFSSYMFCGMSTLFHAFALSFIQKCGEPEKNPVQTFYLSSFFSLPLLLVTFFLSDEAAKLATYLRENPDSFQTSFQVNLFFVVLFGCVLCYSQFWCTTHNNAITTSVIGVLKSFVQTMLGIFVYEARTNMTFLVLLGIFINLVFGTWYTYLKYIEEEVSVGGLLLSKTKKSPKLERDLNDSDVV